MTPSDRHPLRLYKREKLCSVTAIETLFSRDGSSFAAVSYPLRVVWRENTSARPLPEGIRFMITVPKKKLRHAVDRVSMRRRIREAYRLNRHLISEEMRGRCFDVAFVYLASELIDYRHISSAMTRALAKIAERNAKPTTHDANS